jgi:hypothetical protein
VEPVSASIFLWKAHDANLPDATILESLTSHVETSGVGLNPLGIAIPGSWNIINALRRIYFARAPGFLELDGPLEDAQYFAMGQGSEDYSPVIYSRSGIMLTAAFCRNALFEEGVYAAAIAAGKPPREAVALMKSRIGRMKDSFAPGMGEEVDKVMDRQWNAM